MSATATRVEQDPRTVVGNYIRRENGTRVFEIFSYSKQGPDGNDVKLWGVDIVSGEDVWFNEDDLKHGRVIQVRHKKSEVQYDPQTGRVTGSARRGE